MTEPFFDDEDLAELIELDESAMPDRITFEPEDAEPITAICRFAARSGDAATDEAVIAEIGRYVVNVPLATRVPEARTRARFQGSIYYIVYTPEPSGLSTSREVGLTERS